MQPDDVKTWDVLLIDDNVDSITIVNYIFDFHGAKFRTADSGSHGLNLLQQRHPSVVLVDIQMPQMSGWEVLKCIREDTALKNLPVIAFTANAMSGDRERILLEGFDGYIQKPIQVDSFISEIQSILERWITKQSAVALAHFKQVEASPESRGSHN